MGPTTSGSVTLTKRNSMLKRSSSPIHKTAARHVLHIRIRGDFPRHSRQWEIVVIAMSTHSEINLTRECDAVQIPSGHPIVLPAGMSVVITQSLGGTFTVATPGGLARIDLKDADALGLDPEKGIEKIQVTGDLEEAVWNQLKSVFDPEIPVNVVDLGLIYDCTLNSADGKTSALVKMTLTAPGCGMGPTIAAAPALR